MPGLRPIALLLTLLVLSVVSFAATPESVLRGSVSDPKGSAIPNASIEIKIDGTIGKTSNTDEKGEFIIAIEPGRYVLAVSASGFNSLQRAVTVAPGASNFLELTLEVATATAVVNIADGAAYRVGTISSATKTYTALRDIPQSISLTTGQQIAEQNFTSIGDVVRYQPGITAHQGENNRDQVIIRGQSSSADFFVNGVRDDVQYYRDLYNLERVEILRGPNALAFGRGGGGGVINRVTKEASFTPFYELSMQGGTYGNARGTFDLNRAINKKLAFRANGVGERSDSFRSEVSLRRFGFSPTVTFTPDSKTHITVGAEIFRDRRTADRGITSFRGKPADVPVSTYYGNPNDSRVRANANLFTGSVDRLIGKLVLRNRTMYGDYDRFYQNYVPGASNSAGTLVTLTAYNNATQRRNLFNQTDLIYYFKTASIKHTLLGGFELGSQQTESFRNTGYFNNISTSTQVAFDEPTTSTQVTFRQSAADADNRVNVKLAAGYVQDQI